MGRGGGASNGPIPRIGMQGSGGAGEKLSGKQQFESKSKPGQEGDKKEPKKLKL